MRIKNEIMLHISRKTDWKIGDIIDVGKMKTHFGINVELFHQKLK